jgi:Glycosyltransferase family 87
VNPTQTIPAGVPEVQSPGGSPKERLGASRPAVPLYALLAVLAFCTLWTLLGSILVQGARQHDFLNLYAGASLARDGGFAGMHVPEVQLQRERELAPQLRELVPFVRPPFYALLLAPLAWLPFGPAFWAWLGLQAGVLAATWIWAFRRWGTDALIFGSMYLPTALGIAHGQDCALILAIVLGTYALADRGQHFSSGAILGLGLIKFHLFLLWPLALLVQQRWRMLAGACVTVTAELLASLVLAGPSGLTKYVALLRMSDLRHLSPSPELMINLRALAINFGIDHIAATGLLTAAAAILTIAACWRAPLWRCIAAASAGSLLVAPHVYGYDAGLLLVGLWLAMFEGGEQSATRFPRIAATVLLTPIPFLLSLAGSPWPAATPLALLAFLASLAYMGPWSSSVQEQTL